MAFRHQMPQLEKCRVLVNEVGKLRLLTLSKKHAIKLSCLDTFKHSASLEV